MPAWLRAALAYLFPPDPATVALHRRVEALPPLSWARLRGALRVAGLPVGEELEEEEEDREA